MTAWYNEIDPYAAQWLRNLIAAGEIPAGDVDERPIEEVSGDEIRHYTQCHFFAGIGGWAFAARLAGWPDDRPLWTGSCPCQPFSAAGKRLADRDPRNLWPDFARLIAECRPARIAGEQVASKAGRLWLAGVREDMEALGYAVGAADLCAAGVSAPHARQRLWWMADANATGWRGEPPGDSPDGPLDLEYGNHADGRRMDDRRLSDAESQRRQQGRADTAGRDGRDSEGEIAEAWRNSRWVACTGGKLRRLKPGIEPLVTRLPGHVEQVRAYGNSIVPQEAAEFLMAWQESIA